LRNQLRSLLCKKKLQNLRWVRAGVILGLMSTLASGCGSTIHTESNIGGVDTLSIDAKQRLMLVGTRDPTRSGEYPIRVTCTEPSPDALVAKAAVLSANVNVTAPAGEYGGSAGLAGGTSETAASIGFRDHTVQMLRDGYFRLCEAYLNGALSKTKYEHMVTNADTFMAVVSALEVLGSQTVAPAVAISAGGITASSKDGANSTINPGTGATINIKEVTGTKPDPANAKVVGEIGEAVLIGPVSTRNSLVTGIFAGNFANSASLQRREWPIRTKIQLLADEFPAQQNREFLRRNRDFLDPNREFQLPKSKTSPDEVFGTHR
jgi:hypothetical protein